MGKTAAKLTPRELSAELEKGTFRPAYYFYCTDDYRMKEAEKYLAKLYLGPSFNTEFRKFDARKTKSADLINQLAAYPMLGGRQAFSVSEFQNYKPTEIERILKTLDPPDNNRLVIFSSPSQRMPKGNSAFLNTVSAKMPVVKFDRLTEKETIEVVSKKLSRLGLTVDHDAFSLLIKLTAGNRGAIETELEKLRDFAGTENSVSKPDVERICSGFEEHQVFKLADTIAGGSESEALQSLTRLMEQGNNATALLYYLGQHFIGLYRAKNNLSFGRMSWKSHEYRKQAHRFSDKSLEQILLLIADSDSVLRNNPPSPLLVMQQLTTQMLTTMGRPAH